MEVNGTTKRFIGIRLALLAALVLQNTATVLVGRYTRSSVDIDLNYDVNAFLLVSECTKLCFSILLEWLQAPSLSDSLRVHIIEQQIATLKMAIPAGTYLASNSLLYVGLSNLTVPLYQTIYQGKLVVTAIVSCIMLSRKYSLQQWLCLIAISLGVAVVASDDKKEIDHKENFNFVVGGSAMILSCLLSSFASVFFEKLVKNTAEGNETVSASLWIRNIQLSFFSIIIAGSNAYYSYVSQPTRQPLLHGFHAWVWLQVALFGAGGLLVAGVIKYADNVLKGMAMGISVVTTTICSVVLFGTPVTQQFLCGAAIIVPSVYLYSYPCNSSAYSLSKMLVKHWISVSTTVIMIFSVFSVYGTSTQRSVSFSCPSTLKGTIYGKHSVTMPSDFQSVNLKKQNNDENGSVKKSFGLHSVRHDVLGEQRPEGISDTEWLLTKPFSDIKDGDLLLEWEKTRAPEEQNMLTFVMSVTGRYDLGPIDVSEMPLAGHPKVKFLFFSDDMNYTVFPPWQHSKIEYPKLDSHVDMGYRNSLSRTIQFANKTAHPRKHHFDNMYTKYFCHLWWRIPELRRSRYVAYVGGGMNIKYTPLSFLDEFLTLLDGKCHRIHLAVSRPLQKEAKKGNKQERYRIDNVLGQAEYYVSNYQVPESLPTPWLGLSFYDNYHTPTRQVLFDTWVETQLWSLEDQVSYPAMLHFNGQVNTTKMVAYADFFSDFLRLPPNEPHRFPHTRRESLSRRRSGN